MDHYFRQDLPGCKLVCDHTPCLKLFIVYSSREGHIVVGAIFPVPGRQVHCPCQCRHIVVENNGGEGEGQDSEVDLPTVLDEVWQLKACWLDCGKVLLRRSMQFSDKPYLGYSQRLFRRSDFPEGCRLVRTHSIAAVKSNVGFKEK